MCCYKKLLWLNIKVILECNVLVLQQYYILEVTLLKPPTVCYLKIERKKEKTGRETIRDASPTAGRETLQESPLARTRVTCKHVMKHNWKYNRQISFQFGPSQVWCPQAICHFEPLQPVPPTLYPHVWYKTGPGKSFHTITQDFKEVICDATPHNRGPAQNPHCSTCHPTPCSHTWEGAGGSSAMGDLDTVCDPGFPQAQLWLWKTLGSDPEDTQSHSACFQIHMRTHCVLSSLA